MLLEEKKPAHVIELRDSILTSKTVFLKTLQRYSGKRCSLFLAMLTIFLGSSKTVEVFIVYEELKNELLFGKFIENWKGLATCRDKKYLWRVLGTDFHISLGSISNADRNLELGGLFR